MHRFPWHKKQPVASLPPPNGSWSLGSSEDGSNAGMQTTVRRRPATPDLVSSSFGKDEKQLNN